MSLEVTFKECCSGLRSIRATERKKNAEALKDYLTRNAVPSLLSENTIKQIGYSWTDTFNDINEYLFKEAEKLETSKTFETSVVPLCSSLLSLCVAGANKGKAYIKCDILMDTTLSILRDSRLAKAVGDAYLNVLYKNILMCDQYLKLITPKTWEELLDVCIRACLLNHSKLDDFTKLRLVYLIVNKGSNCCQFIIPLRDSLSKFKKCFAKVSYDKRVQEIVIEIVTLLLKSLSPDCRLSMCEFTETMMTTILKFYDQNLEQKKKASFFKLLALCVGLHHPKGRFREQEGSLAHDWSTWNKSLHSILEIVSMEASYLQKSKKLNEDIKFYTDYYTVAASTYLQIFHVISQHDNDDDDDANTSKRQRTTLNKIKNFSDIVEELRQNHVPWLGVIDVYLRNFASSVSTVNLVALLNTFEQLALSNNIDWDIFENVICSSLKQLECVKSEVNEYDALILSVWNPFVRNSTSTNGNHKAVHHVLRLILSSNIVSYAQVHSLLKLYLENVMPITNPSVVTLNQVFQKFFNKCSPESLRLELFTWFKNGDLILVSITDISEFLLRIIANKNLDTKAHLMHKGVEFRDILFDSTEECILFSEFEMEYPQAAEVNHDLDERIELNSNVNKSVNWFITTTLTKFTENVGNIEIIEFIQFVQVTLAYIDINLKFNASVSECSNSEIDRKLNLALTQLNTLVVQSVQSNIQVESKIKILNKMQEILSADYDLILIRKVRECLDSSFFHSINKIMCSETETEDAEDMDCNPNTLRHSCVSILASYSQKPGRYRQSVLDLIMDAKIYDFTLTWDIESAFNCIQVLMTNEIDEPTLDMIFTLLRSMCRSLFRDSQATMRLITILKSLLDQIWRHSNEVMKKNCFIMVKSYLQRCDQGYYSPEVAASIYECAARIFTLNCKTPSPHVDSDLIKKSILEKIKGPLHNIRIFCCYLAELIIKDWSEAELELYLCDLVNIFTINVSEKKPLILKDESANRTLTVLHTMFALSRIKRSLLHRIVLTMLQLQKEKSLDRELVQKVLNLMTNKIVCKNLSAYLNECVLSILHFWFSTNNYVDGLPIEFFEMSVGSFVEKHIGWLVPAEILWLKKGKVEDSAVIQEIVLETGKSQETVIEACFDRIMSLCLPHVVTEEFNLGYKGGQTPDAYRISKENALRMFYSTRDIIGYEKWSHIFVENINEIVLLTAKNFRDPIETEHRFKITILRTIESYCYPKNVFTAILSYFGKLIDGNIMQFLCENQPQTVFRVLSQLWQDVLHERVMEMRILILNTFITIVEECVPLDYASDPFVCNFICNSLAHAIKESKDSMEIQAFSRALWFCLQKFLPEKVDILRKSIAFIMSVLLIKKEEGFNQECSLVWEYLSLDMREYLKEGEDVIDFIQSLSQGFTRNYCSTRFEFLEKLKTYESSLSCPSHEALVTMRDFIKNNKQFLYDASKEHRTVENCGVGVVHDVIATLCKVFDTATDTKTIIETCNCLTEIGHYDLRTLVTKPPSNTQQVVDMPPNQYFAYAVLKSLSHVLFDENPIVTDNVINTLNQLLKYREGKDAMDLGEVDQEMLKPFTSLLSNISAAFKIDKYKFEEYSNVSWVPKVGENNYEWVKRIAVAILDIFDTKSNYVIALREVCILKPSVCGSILPSLIGLMLQCASEPQIKTISQQLNNSFKHIWDITKHNVEDSQDLTIDKSDVCREHKRIIYFLLKIVNFVRLQRSHYKSRPERTTENLNYLRLEYDKVAWAATIADQSVTALYYGELWAIGNNDGVPPSTPEATSLIDGGEFVQTIFRKCYVAIGEMDAIDGCGTAHLTSEHEKRKHLLNIGEHSDALLLHDIALSCGSQKYEDLQYGVVKSLHKSGMHHLALQYIKSLPESDKLNDMKYDCLSFLGDWSDCVDTKDLEQKSNLKDNNSYSVIKAFHYSCLKDCLNIHTDSESDCKMVLPLNRARIAISKLCLNMNMVNCQNVYKVIGNLHLLNDIEEYFSVRCNKSSVSDLLDNWQVTRLPPYHDFKHVESLVSQRCLILEHAAKYNGHLKDIVSLQLDYTKLCVANNNIQMAQRLLAMVKKVNTTTEVALAEAQISWAKGHRDIAISLIKNIANLDEDENLMTAMSLRQFGIWMAETRSDNAREIIDQYLKKSLNILSRIDHKETRLQVYYDIAKFADAEYKQVVNYMNSSIFENKVKCLETLKGTASSLRSTQQTLSSDERRALITNEKFRDLDENEIANTRAEKESFLHLAMRYYLLSLKNSEENNLSVFRVISLWLDNPNLRLEDSEAGSFEDFLHAIPSRKFITVLPQLAPRLTNDSSAFAVNLRMIIKRCATEHPHHTLPILFSLKNSEKDKQILNVSQRPGKNIKKESEPRVAAADSLVKQLAREGQDMANIVIQMERMCDAMISFAYFKSPSNETKQRIPAAELINKLGALDAIPLLTVTMPVREDCTYSSLITLISFENYFELVGGNNCPKKITCKCSDGTKRILLVKGEDDLRQDAVMQQVFNIVNTLLEKDPVTSRNNLLIRTYKVAALSRRSGVLQWCAGTAPLGAYLAGANAAHTRYRPTDITPKAARQKLTECYEKRKSNKEKLIVFLRILKEFKPVFHYFFTEHYLDPVTWYERRMAYTKSVATSSMIGYILGLGDRHVQNILIDKKTAEVIHIDFGIAFDHGKALPTPETIPFRLTQDMIAGFGASGIEGVFRKSCEKTMQLLRDNSETLLTILEVLLCDPLYSWTVTTQQNKDTSMQCMSGSSGSLAARALLAVGCKLRGAARQAAVAGQVAHLLAAATSATNLSRLYPGWQPYL